MKAIILAGGTGTRLYPLTQVVCKQLLPVYDKPVISYPLSLCLLSNISEILIISTPEATPVLKNFLKDGADLGCSIQYAVQQKADGIANALIIGESFLAGSPCLLLLGDNLIVKSGFVSFMANLISQHQGARVFGSMVQNPEQFGVIEFDQKTQQVLSIEEKPRVPKSNMAAIGMYLYDHTAPERAKSLKPSVRGELEITDLNLSYLKDRALSCSTLSRGDFWGDLGTFESLNDCANYIRLHQQYTRSLIGSPEECALRMGRITQEQFVALKEAMPDNCYFKALKEQLV